MILALAGGVGGAKLAAGLQAALEAPEDLLVVVNTGDDFEHLGLSICPDLDTVMYTLSGRANPETGWGHAGESWNFLEALGALGGEDWFRLGDRDLATHVERTRRLRAGETLSRVTADLAAASLDLAFTNIADTFGVLSNDMRWQGVSMENGSFQTTGLDGRFYGPNHEEAGGVFERDGIAGAFSLARQ